MVFSLVGNDWYIPRLSFGIVVSRLYWVMWASIITLSKTEAVTSERCVASGRLAETGPGPLRTTF